MAMLCKVNIFYLIPVKNTEFRISNLARWKI